MLKKHYADPVKVKTGMLKNFPLRIIGFDLFIVSTPTFITGVAKLAGQTFGTDILATVTLCLSVLCFQLSIFHLTQREFKIFVHGTTNPKEAMKAKRLRDFLKCFGLLFFIGVTVVPSLWTLSTNKAIGPIENNEEMIIYLRNIGAIVYALLDMFTTGMIRTRVRKLLSSNGGDEKAITFIVNKMDAEMRTYIIFSGTIGVVYAIFVIPFLLQFQTYIIAFIVGLGSLRHSGKAFAKDSDTVAYGISNSKRSSKQADGTYDGGGESMTSFGKQSKLVPASNTEDAEQ